jgi:spectinomycin phosphotransferase
MTRGSRFSVLGSGEVPVREPPKIAEETIVTALRAHYGIAVAALTFLPLGADATAGVYRVQAADGTAYFLKVRADPGSATSLVVPHYLHGRGLPHILAPVATNGQALWVTAGGFALILYPFIEGRNGTEAGLSPNHWRAFGALVRQIHSTTLPPNIGQIIRRETYTPGQRSMIDELDTALTAQEFADPLARELAAFWRARRDEIHTLAARADALGRRLERASAPLVLCHADMHTWNVMIDTSGQLWLVDWDETTLAPKERDLMFVIGGIGHGLVSPEETACFLEGYGETAIDPCALAYYRYAWALQDIAAYGEQALLRTDLELETRREGLQFCMAQFGPGDIVEIAMSSELSHC